MENILKIAALLMMLVLTACKAEKKKSAGLDQVVPATNAQRQYIQKTFALHVPGCKLTQNMLTYWESQINRPDGEQQMREAMQSVGASNPPCMDRRAVMIRPVLPTSEPAPKIDTSLCIFGIRGVTEKGVLCATEEEASGRRVATVVQPEEGRVTIMGSAAESRPTGVR